MMFEPYNERVRKLFATPAHSGRLDEAIAVSVDDQGVRIELSAHTDKGSIQSLRFRARGCPHVIAAAETVCAEYEGRAISDLDEFAAAELMQSLAVPMEKSGRILVVEDAVRLLGAALREASSATKEQN